MAAGESEEPCTLAWRVLNRPSEGRRGVSVSVEVPSLERALLSYHARPLSPAGRGGRFFGEGIFDEQGIFDEHDGAGESGARTLGKARGTAA